MVQGNRLWKYTCRLGICMASLQAYHMSIIVTIHYIINMVDMSKQAMCISPVEPLVYRGGPSNPFRS